MIPELIDSKQICKRKKQEEEVTLFFFSKFRDIFAFAIDHILRHMAVEEPSTV